MLKVIMPLMRKLHWRERKFILALPMTILGDYFLDKGYDVNIFTYWYIYRKFKHIGELEFRESVETEKAGRYFFLYPELSYIILGDFAPTKNGLIYVNKSRIAHIRPYATGRTPFGRIWERIEAFRFVEFSCTKG